MEKVIIPIASLLVGILALVCVSGFAKNVGSIVKTKPVLVHCYEEFVVDDTSIIEARCCDPCEILPVSYCGVPSTCLAKAQ